MNTDKVVFHLPTGDVQVSESAVLYFELSKSLPRMITAAISDSVNSFPDFVMQHAHCPSEYFSQQDFEDIEGSSEEPLRKLFGQIIDALSAYLLKNSDLNTWLGGESKLSDFLESNFSYASYRTRCASDILDAVSEKIKKAVSSLDWSASIASRQVHEHRNKESGIVGSIYHGLKEGSTKKSFCEKCDAKFRACAEDAASIVKARLPPIVSDLTMASLVAKIGIVCSGMNIVEYREHVKRHLMESNGRNMLLEAMKFLPYEPVVIRHALAEYGDREKIVSVVGSRFGVDVEAEKVELLEELAQKATDADERIACGIRMEFEDKVSALCLENPDKADPCRRRILDRVECLDKSFRTVAGVVFPTRIEAAMTRNDAAFLSEVLGEDVTPLIALLARESSLLQTAKEILPFGQGNPIEIVTRCSEVITRLTDRTHKSPFMHLIERALTRVRDAAFYAGNTRFDSEEDARAARAQRQESLRQLFKNTSDRQFNFQIDAGVCLKLKAKGWLSVFSKNKEDPFERYVVDRFLGVDLPEDVRTLRDVLKWQLGFDFIESTSESFVEISSVGLPRGYVSLVQYTKEDGTALFSDDDVAEDIDIPHITFQPYRKSMPVIGEGSESCQ